MRLLIALLQTEKAFQKQSAVFVGKFRTLAKKNKKDLRFVRNVGLGIKTPKEAVTVRHPRTLIHPVSWPCVVIARPAPAAFDTAGHVHRQEVPVHG